MKSAIGMAVAIAVCPLLASCDRMGEKYEISRAGNQTLLLNKHTGEVRAIEGTALLSIESPSAALTKGTDSKAWPDLKVEALGGVTVKLKTKYRDGQLLYVAMAGPYEGAIERAFKDALGVARFGIELTDAEGFRIGTPIDLPINVGTRIVDDKGNPSREQWTGAQPMSPEAYAAIARTEITWAGFKPN